MKTVKVIPLSSKVAKEYLTYFTSKNVSLGSIVSVPVRKKMIDAMVIEMEEVEVDKSALKSASFNLKKIDTVKGPSPFGESFFRAAEKASHYFVGTIGGVLDALLPEYIFKYYNKLNFPLVATNEAKSNISQEKLVFQGADEDRIGFYKTSIRESFARKQSVYLLLPTIQEILYFEEILKKGIEQYVFSFHADMGSKQFIASYNACMSEEHPVLIIGTGLFLFLPRNDLGSLIVEHESSGAYRTLARPYVDFRTIAELYSHEKNIKLILGDTLLRPETLHRTRIGEFGEIAPLSFRVRTINESDIINTTVPEDPEAKARKKKSVRFEVLSEETRNLIQTTIARDEQMFLFALRKGLAPITICNDCGTTLLCEHCSSPLVLYGGEGKHERIFICNKCKREKETDVICKKCGSWNMVPLGIGTERVAEEVETLFPKSSIIRFDKDSIKNAASAKKSMALFFKTPGAIMVGTEFALHYFSQKVARSAIVSFDSLFSIPNFRLSEKIIHLVASIRALTDQEFILQTKNKEDRILTALASGNLLGLYRDELEERKALRYPPFATLVKITYRGSESDVEAKKEMLAELLKDYNPDIMNAFIKKMKGSYSTNALIKIDSSLWTLPGLSREGRFDTTLEGLLRSLPPSFSVHVDPEDIL